MPYHRYVPCDFSSYDFVTAISEGYKLHVLHHLKLFHPYTFESSEATDFPAEDEFVEPLIKRLAEEQ